MTRLLIMAGALLACLCSAAGQSPIASVVYQATATGSPETISIQFSEELHFDLAARTVSVGGPVPSQTLSLDKTILFRIDATTNLITQVLADAVPAPGPGGVNFGLDLKNFRDTLQHPVSLRTGGPTSYTIVLRGTTGKDDLLTSVKAKDAATVPIEPQLVITDSTFILAERASFGLQLNPTEAVQLAALFRSSPQRLIVRYVFDPDDPAPDLVTVVERFEATPNISNIGSINVVPRTPLPWRPKPYKVVLEIPVSALPPSLAAQFQLGVSTAIKVTGKASFVPPSVDRPTSEYYFETTLDSTVSFDKTKKRNVRLNSGIFGVHLKPVLKTFSWNTTANSPGKPWWGILSPLLESDVDTLPTSTSKSPNKTTFGFDFEAGRDGATTATIAQWVFTNGSRFDSDRDFKVITSYWHTEIAPRFNGFEQTQVQRLFRWNQSHIGAKPGSFAKQPFVTAFRFNPSTGYDLGGVVRRAGTPIPEIGDTVSRFFVTLDTSVEMERFITLSAKNTGYYIETASRRPLRAYFESKAEFNTGILFHTDFFRFQNSILVKFLRGEQPPKFAPVNSISVGLKISR